MNRPEKIAGFSNLSNTRIAGPFADILSQVASGQVLINVGKASPAIRVSDNRTNRETRF